MPSESDLAELLKRHRVVVCAGAGGVGKTTMSAGLATLGASLGMATLCLTIDPARRLAQAFGIEDFSTNAQEVSDHVFSGVKLDVAPGPLTVMMLEPRETFDSIVQAGLSSPDQKRRVLSLKVYDHLARNLAGTQAYMAMEKVCAEAANPKWDLIVLDTPPSAKALDFFDAPIKMGEILDSPATRALLGALRGGERLRPGIFGVGMRAALAGMQRVTGGRLLSDVAELISSMNQLLGGFAERAQRLKAQMQSDEFGYVLVTSPDATVVSDVFELGQAMRTRGLSLDALICNRISDGGAELARDQLTREFFANQSTLREGQIDASLVERIVDASEYEDVRRIRQLELCASLKAGLGNGASRISTTFVPELDDEEQRAGIWTLARLLSPIASQPDLGARLSR